MSATRNTLSPKKPAPRYRLASRLFPEIGSQFQEGQKIRLSMVASSPFPRLKTEEQHEHWVSHGSYLDSANSNKTRPAEEVWTPRD